MDTNVNEIKYQQFSNLIRYYKGISDKLYVYLAAAEKYLRNIIFDEIEIDKIIRDTTDIELDINDMYTKSKSKGNLM